MSYEEFLRVFATFLRLPSEALKRKLDQKLENETMQTAKAPTAKKSLHENGITPRRVSSGIEHTDDTDNFEQADIIFKGTKIVLPEGMHHERACDLIQRHANYLQQTVSLSETFNVFPFDGAVALDHVLTEMFGWAPSMNQDGPWGMKIKPQLLNVRVGPNPEDVTRVAWGKFELPDVQGFVECEAPQVDGRFQFALRAEATRKDEAKVQQLFRKVAARLKTHSIYSGKAIKITFTDDDGDVIPMPQPSFIDTDQIDPDQLIFSDHVRAAIETNLFTPILRVKDLLENGIQVKRGVCLAGTYGTGKTLAAMVAAKHAVDSGITYLYCPKASDFTYAIEFVKQYQDENSAAVLFVEDIDRAVSGDRDEDTDEILNTLDGIDTKHANIISVLTTNALESLEPAMLRPGRLDAVIEVTPPDAKAVEKLLRFYGGASIEKSTDLTEAGVILQGNIPAVIAEVVARAKLSQLRMQAPGERVRRLSSAALVEASRTMAAQVDLLNRRSMKPPVEPTAEELIGEAVADKLIDPLRRIGARLGAHID